MSGPTILNGRLSLVHAECFFDHRWAAEAPLPVPWRRAYYEDAYGKLQGGAAVPGFAQAWRPRQQSRFWSFYLGGQALGGVSARAAWEALVPLRLTASPAPTLTTDEASERLFFDCYGYPEGLTVALTIQTPARRETALSAWRDRLRQLRRNAVFTLTLSGLPARPAMTAADALKAIADWYRTAYYGPVAQVFGADEPASIAAVIQARGFDRGAAIDDGLHRMLYAITAWPLDWHDVALPDLAAPGVVLPVRQRNVAPGDALYAAARGRTVWRPLLFSYRRSPGEKPPHTLGCLVHNVVAGTVQAETLRLFAIGYAASPRARRDLDPGDVQRVASKIDALVRGEQTYRSSSAAAFLAETSSKSAVNALLVDQGFAAIP